MVSIPINDTDWTLSLSLFPCAHFLSHLTRFPTLKAINAHCLSADEILFRCVRSRLFLLFKLKTRNQDVTAEIHAIAKAQAFVVLLTQCSSDDNTPLASPYTTTLVSKPLKCSYPLTHAGELQSEKTLFN